jgi:hypothetical protein
MWLRAARQRTPDFCAEISSVTNNSHVTLASCTCTSGRAKVPDERQPIGFLTGKARAGRVFWNCPMLRQMRHDLNDEARKELCSGLFRTAESGTADNKARNVETRGHQTLLENRSVEFCHLMTNKRQARITELLTRIFQSRVE